MGLKDPNKKFYLVEQDILPEAIRKTAMAKELLNREETLTVNEAVQRAGLSRSAYYKYKDGVFPFYSATKDQIVTVSLNLEHQPGVLSQVLNTIAATGASVLTINQGLPLQGLANVSISLETAEMRQDLEQLMGLFQQMHGVKKVEVVGRN